MIVFLGFCVFIILNFVWLVYSITHSYWIILRGLREVYWVWLLHLYLTVMNILQCCLRPAYDPSVAEWVHSIPALCHFIGRWGVIHSTLMRYNAKLEVSFEGILVDPGIVIISIMSNFFSMQCGKDVDIFSNCAFS